MDTSKAGRHLNLDEDALVELLRLPMFRGVCVFLQNHLLYLHLLSVPAVGSRCRYPVSKPLNKKIVRTANFFAVAPVSLIPDG